MSDLKRFSLEELEVACIEAHMSGRIYNKGGEKALPGDEHRAMLKRALIAVGQHRREKRKRTKERHVMRGRQL